MNGSSHLMTGCTALSIFALGYLYFRDHRNGRWDRSASRRHCKADRMANNPTDAERVADMEALRELCENMRTQDNRGTHLPIFMVQERVRECGFSEDFSENRCWLLEGSLHTADEKAEIDAEQAADEGALDWTETGYRDRWQHVQPFLTEAAAQRYIDDNRHNLTEPRIYAESGYRNREWELLRRVLPQLVDPGVARGDSKKAVIE